jgi:hypothetical protein
MFPSLATPDASDASDDVASILALIDEDEPMPKPVRPSEDPVSAAAREKREAAARTRAWRERQKEATDVNQAVVDALVTADLAQRLARPLDGAAHWERPIVIADVTRLAYTALRKMGYEKQRAHELLVPRLTPARPPIVV